MRSTIKKSLLTDLMMGDEISQDDLALLRSMPRHTVNKLFHYAIEEMLATGHLTNSEAKYCFENYNKELNELLEN
jgi:hypothetical protein